MPIDILPYVHPELQALIPQLAQVTAAASLTREMLPAMRTVTPAFLPRARSAPLWIEKVIPGMAGAPDVRLLVINAGLSDARPKPAILHLHGGGFVAGSAAASLWRTQELAEALDCVVVSVDYRLAPETPFPGALDDSYAALVWMHDSAEELGLDPDRIALVGESAGGGHAATLAAFARDRGEVQLRYQALIYPMLDDCTGSTAERPRHMGAILWTPERNRFGWGCLLGKTAGSVDVPHGAVPARQPDLTRLPPTWIGVGSIDLFFEEDLEYARRLAGAGVSVRLTVVPGAFHIFDAFRDLAVAQNFRADLIAALRGALA